MIWAIVSSWSFLLTVWSFSILFACREYNPSDFGVGHLVMFLCTVFSRVVGRGCLLWLVRFLRKTITHWPASLCPPKPKLAVTWGSQGKSTQVVCHSLLQSTPVCGGLGPPWPVFLRRPYIIWLIVSLS